MQKQTAIYLDSILAILKEHAQDSLINGKEVFNHLNIPHAEYQTLISILSNDTTAKIEQASGDNFHISATDKGVTLIVNNGYSAKLKKEKKTDKYEHRQIHNLALQIIKSWVWFVFFVISLIINILFLLNIL